MKKGGKSQNSTPPQEQAECLCFEPLVVGEEDETQESQAPESGTTSQESAIVTQYQRREGGTLYDTGTGGCNEGPGRLLPFL